MRLDFVAVSKPTLHFHAGVVKAHEPVSVQAFGLELAIERLDEGVVGGLSWAGEIEHHILLICPEIKVAGDEFRALVDPDRLRISYFPANLFKRPNDILTSVAEPGIYSWCVA